MNIRRLILCTGVILSLATLALAFTRSPINPRSFGRIQEGMTEQEVVKTIGLPPGDYSTGTLVARVRTEEIPRGIEPAKWAEFLVTLRRPLEKIGWTQSNAREWVGNRGIITVYFDSAGQVVDKDYLAVYRRLETPLEFLERWLNL